MRNPLGRALYVLVVGTGLYMLVLLILRMVIWPDLSISPTAGFVVSTIFALQDYRSKKASRSGRTGGSGAELG